MPRSNVEAQHDVLFLTIEQLLSEQQSRTRGDRRNAERSAYRCIQLLAPFNGRELPEQQDFRPIQCHDLSPRGLSFWMEERPAVRQFIVALGKVPFKFLEIEVVRITQHESHGATRYHVGCRFVRRFASDLVEPGACGGRLP